MAYLVVRRRAVPVNGGRVSHVGAWRRVLRHGDSVDVVEDRHLVVAVFQRHAERHLCAGLLLRLPGQGHRSRSQVTGHGQHHQEGIT